MGNLGFPEMLVIAVVALLVFGPERLPELARNAGKALARFRQEAGRSVDELKRAADLEGFDEELRSIRADVDGVRGSLRGALGGLATGTPTKDVTRPVDRPPPTDPEAT